MRGILKPDPSYVWRPDQMARRVFRKVRGAGEPLVTLPWGNRIRVSSSDLIGSGIVRLSTYELTVTEAMWRLTNADDTAIDVGANVGYYTSLLSRRARRVLAFEPHPKTAAQLRANVALWDGADIEVREMAVSDREGTATLWEPIEFKGNSGAATLEPAESAGRPFEVRLGQLDEIVGSDPVGVLKLDVEGHELSVLSGFAEALGAGRVRDVFFEDHESLPTPVSKLLTKNGFEVFSLQPRFRGVELGPPDGPRPRWYAPTYLATLDPARAARLVRPTGWHCLRPR